MNTDDKELISQCLDGQTESFGKLVERYQNRLYHTLFSIMGSEEDARDVAQETFVLAFQKLKSFRGDSAFYSWLFRIAFNASVSFRRKHRRTISSLDAAQEQSGIETVDDNPDSQPTRSIEVEEQQLAVRTALTQLADEFREVLALKEMEGLKYEQIAEIVGCPIGTVRSRIHRARHDLREKLRVILKEQ